MATPVILIHRGFGKKGDGLGERSREIKDKRRLLPSKEKGGGIRARAQWVRAKGCNQDAPGSTPEKKGIKMRGRVV